MENNFNIDELIRKGMSDFQPSAPPEVWEAIEKQIQLPGAQVVTPKSTFMELVKQSSLLVKTLVVAGVSVATLGAVLLMNPKQETTGIVSSEKPDMPQLVQEEKVELPSASFEKGKNIKQGDSGKTRVQVKADHQTFDAGTKEIAVTQNENMAPEGNLVQPEKTNYPIRNQNEKAKTEKGANEPAVIHRNAGQKQENTHSFPMPEPEYGNAITPDGNGENDVWEIRISRTNFFHLRVFDMKNQLVFETEQPEIFWNGNNQKTGLECESGSYAFILDYQYEKADKVLSKTGFINLLR